MSTDDETDRTRSQSEHVIKYKVGDFVLLSNHREGIIGYKGPLDNNPSNVIFYGIELLNGGVGESDGVYADKRYFQTLPQRATFVTVESIRRVMIGKDYRSPQRLDRRQSLQAINQGRSSAVNLIKQSEYELAIYDVAEEVEAKCDILDDIKEESKLIDQQTSLQNASKSMPLTKNKKRRGRRRGRSNAQRRYMQNANNIDNDREQRLEQMKKRKSFNRVKLDKTIKTKAISGFKKKLKKQTQKDKMFKNEEESIQNAKVMIDELGFLKKLKDFPRLMKTSKKRKKRKRKKQSKSTKKSGAKTVETNLFTQNVHAAPIKKVNHHIKNGKIDNSVTMNKVIMTQKRRKKRKRKKLQFDDDGAIVGSEERKVQEVNTETTTKSTDATVVSENSERTKEETAAASSETTTRTKNNETEAVAVENVHCYVDEYEYEVLDMNNTNTLTTLSEKKSGILQNVICEVLRTLDTLQAIEMCNCGLDDKFMSKICNILMQCDHNIWCLNMQSNPIGNDGMLSLAQLIAKNNEYLTHIKLQNNRKNISTEACEAMCNALEGNEYITMFEFEFRHFQHKDKCKKVLRRNNERARKLRIKKQI